LYDKSQIEAFLRKNIYLNIYAIGDLDDFFWNDTVWYGLTENNAVRAVILLYTGSSLPTVHALSGEADTMRELLRSIFHVLPSRFYAHVSPGVETAFQGQYRMQSFGKHYKMALNDKSIISGVDCPRVIRLTEKDLDEVRELYEQAYPRTWFDPRMLNTRQYFGIRMGQKLISVAGIHVYSKRYNVAALGNIATHPHFRGRGLGTSVTARLCQSLSENVQYIGLNVKADNAAPISLYEKLGFEVVTSYYECAVTRCS